MLNDHTTKLLSWTFENAHWSRNKLWL